MYVSELKKLVSSKYRITECNNPPHDHVNIYDSCNKLIDSYPTYKGKISKKYVNLIISLYDK